MIGKLYPYRNLPCDCSAEPWYVAGREIDDHGVTIGSGIVEWCFDEVDARDRLKLMQEYPHQFEDLCIGQYGG